MTKFKAAIAAAMLAVSFGSIAVLAQSPGFTLPSGSIIAGRIGVSNSIAAPAPTVAGASCGTPVLTAGSTDTAGEFQAKGTSTCKLTFGTAKIKKPFCSAVDSTTASTFTYDNTGITMGTTVSNDLISYVCFDTTQN